VALTTTQVQQGLTTGQVVALSTAQVGALETRDVAALGTGQVAALTTTQVQQGLTTSQVVALTTTQVQQGLTTNQLVSLTTRQVDALTTRQVEALTTTQKGSLTTDQIPMLDTLGTPMVLDLNGNGISTQSIDKGTKFDIYGNDQNVNTGWVTGGDGLLVLDRNRDGSINGGRELFGEGTDLATGQKAVNGYQALAELDSNSDGRIDGQDGSFADLMVWVDDGDGSSESGELHSLSSLGITSLDLGAQESTQMDNGNLIGLVSGYTTTDGEVHQMADVWFATNKDASTSLELEKPALVGLAPASEVAPPTPVAPVSDLRTQVGGLVDALQAFSSSGSGGAGGASGDAIPLTKEAPQMAASGGGGMLGMVDALKQFDANGKPLSMGTSGPQPATSVTLNTGAPRKPDTDILASSS
jgi:hypothetical protein